MFVDIAHLGVRESIFPPPDCANSDGFLSISRELSTELLIDAYSHGIFPWFKEGEFYYWFSPPRRAILYPNRFKLTKSLSKSIRNKNFNILCDSAFENVIKACSSVPRKGQIGSWIESGFIESYSKLHSIGVAHSFETWEGESLVGGLYGVSLGKMFVGESMFSLRSDASKVALYHLCAFLDSLGFRFIDAQIQNPHLERLGSVEVDRERYLQELKIALNEESFIGSWSEEFEKYKMKM